MFTCCCLHSALDLLPSSASFLLLLPGAKGLLELLICISKNFHNSAVLPAPESFPEVFTQIMFNNLSKKCSFDGVQQFITVP